MNSRQVMRIVALAVALGCGAEAFAQQFGLPVLSASFNPGSTVKLEQITGDCDWSIWDATVSADPAPVCKPTVSQTTTRFDVLGHDLGANFEANGELLFFFGDTIGASNHYNPRWTSLNNPFQYMAGDTFASSNTRHAEDGLLLDYFVGSDPTHANTIQPIYPAGAAPAACAPSGVIATGADDVPSGGVTLNGQIYFSYASGSDASNMYSHLNTCSILVRFDPVAQTFSAGRQISQAYYPLPNSTGVPCEPPPGTCVFAPGTAPGHFVTNAMHALPPLFGFFSGLEEPSPFGALPWEGGVLIFGEGQHRGEPTGSSVYLSYVPESDFWSGTDSHGNPATRYFAGFKSGHPTWSVSESEAVPVLYDNPDGVSVPSGPPGFADPGTVGEISVAYVPKLGLWLMTYDGGRQSGPGTDSAQSAGVYFSYARFPWGPWSQPQLIFNSCRDQGFGNFMFYPAGDASCGTLVGPSGPAGPMIGANDPNATPGGSYAPEMIERFIEVDGSTLKIFYTLSTWNPYAVILMESDFTLAVNFSAL